MKKESEWMKFLIQEIIIRNEETRFDLMSFMEAFQDFTVVLDAQNYKWDFATVTGFQVVNSLLPLTFKSCHKHPMKMVSNYGIINPHCEGINFIIVYNELHQEYQVIFFPFSHDSEFISERGLQVYCKFNLEYYEVDDFINTLENWKPFEYYTM